MLLVLVEYATRLHPLLGIVGVRRAYTADEASVVLPNRYFIVMWLAPNVSLQALFARHRNKLLYTRTFLQK
jgi:hypothetical protein